jgi:hypothetical protein
LGRESKFQAEVVDDLREIFPGCIIFLPDPNYIQGIPDVLMLYGNSWAALECKISESAPQQPNQSWYVQEMNEMSFAAFIYPENKERILDDLQRSFAARR